MSELIKSIVVIADGCSKDPIEQSLCKKCQWEAGLECKLCILHPAHISFNKPSINTALNILRNRKQS